MYQCGVLFSLMARSTGTNSELFFCSAIQAK